MTQTEGQGEHRHGLGGTLERIARQLKVGGGGFPSPIIYVPDEDFDLEAEAAKHPGSVIFLPAVDNLEPSEEEEAYREARQKLEGGA